MRALELTCAALLWIGCRPTAEVPALSEVLVARCSDVLESPEGPVCELVSGDVRRIRLWVAGELPVVRIDGETLEPVSKAAVDDGWRLEIQVPDGAGTLALARVDAERALWRLPFTWSNPELSTALTQAVEAMYAANQKADRSGCQREAKRVFTLAEAQHRVVSAVRAAMTGATCSSAEPWHEWTAMAAQIPNGSDEREFDRASLEAQYFQRVGAMPQALAAANRGLQWTRRLGEVSLHQQISTIKAAVLAELGDFPAAIAILRGELERGSASRSCLQASLHTDLAWALMLQAERDPAAREGSPLDELRRGLSLAEAPGRGCARAEDVIAFRLNLVRGLQRERRWHEAGRELEILTARLKQDSNDVLRAEFQLLRARQLLAEGQALAAKVALEQTNADGALPKDLLLERTLARGETEEALGSWQTARELYESARSATHDRLGGLPADGGLQRFLVDRLRPIQRLVELTRSRFADDTAAFRIAREAGGAEIRWLVQHGVDPGRQRELLAGRDEQEEELVRGWDRSRADYEALLDVAERAALAKQAALLSGEHSYDPSRLELRPPDDDELLLLYFPLDAHRLMAFAATTAGVEVAVLDFERSALLGAADVWSGVELAAWSERLLAPVAGPIDRARKIRVLPSFGVQALPFHAFPWRGQPLLAHAEVAYGLDLPVRRTRRDRAAEDRVVIVADPLGDLAGARRESEDLRASITASGVVVESLVGLQATGPAVRASLTRADHFHYAGHSASAGAFGWASTLDLAEGTSLTVADIAALDKVPSTAVLLSCDAGRKSRDSRAQGISLAAAFVFAGSEAVVAMSTPIDADEAPQLASVFNNRLTDASSLAMMYRTGLLRLREASLSDTAWQGLRLWVP